MLNLSEENNLLAYADNIVVIGKSWKVIQSTNQKLINIGNDIGLTIKSRNSKYIMEKQGGVDHNNFHLRNKLTRKIWLK